jgi:hypothetical protein
MVKCLLNYEAYPKIDSIKNTVKETDFEDAVSRGVVQINLAQDKVRLQATAEALTKFLLPFKLGNFVTT